MLHELKAKEVATIRVNKGFDMVGMIPYFTRMTKELRQRGLKVTVPRTKILQLLEESNEQHLSAEQIYQLLQDMGERIGLATVYRVLTQFEDAGIVIRHNFEGDRSVFELDHGQHHDHLVCVKCGKVIEFVDPEIEQRQQAICEQHNFQMTDHSLMIYGRCGACGRGNVTT